MRRFSKRPSAERLNGFSGDTHGDKESINPSHRAQGPVGTFLILVFFVRPGEVALLLHWVFSGQSFPLDKYNGFSNDERSNIGKRSPKPIGRPRFENDPNGVSASDVPFRN